MNGKDLRQALMSQTIELLSGLDFTAKFSADHVRFEKKVSYGKNVIYYNIVSFGDTYNLSLFLTVFHKTVEIAHGLALGLNKKSVELRGTVNLAINEYSKHSMQNLKVQTLEDVQQWCEHSVSYVCDTGIKVFDSYSDLHALDRLFNSNPAEEVYGCNYMLSRSEKGIIIAKLCRNPELLELIKRYRSILAELDILLTYEDVVEFINRYDPEELYRLKI